MRREKTFLASGRWTSKFHTWTPVSPRHTLRATHPVRHQVPHLTHTSYANMPLVFNLYTTQYATSEDIYHSRAKTESKKIQNSTPRLPLLMSHEAETDGERHIRGERELRRLHQPSRHLHGRRHPQLPLCCRHLVHAGWLLAQTFWWERFFTCCMCSRHPPTRACTRGWTTGTWQPRTTSQQPATAPWAPTTPSTLPMLPWETATWTCQVENIERTSWSEWM